MRGATLVQKQAVSVSEALKLILFKKLKTIQILCHPSIPCYFAEDVDGCCNHKINLAAVAVDLSSVLVMQP